MVLRPFVRDYPGEPVPEETFTHPSSWSSSNFYQLLPSTTIHSNLPVQISRTHTNNNNANVSVYGAVIVCMAIVRIHSVLLVLLMNAATDP